MSSGNAFAQVAENTAAACRDGVDNDGNGRIDCADPGCAELRFCAHGAAQSAENTAGACRDFIDNDGDGYTDCADQDCGAFVFCAESSARWASAPAPVQPTRRGPGFRWGLSADPGALVITGNALGQSSTTALGGAGFPIRLGYQIKDITVARVGSNTVTSAAIGLGITLGYEAY